MKSRSLALAASLLLLLSSCGSSPSASTTEPSTPSEASSATLPSQPSSSESRPSSAPSSEPSSSQPSSASTSEYVPTINTKVDKVEGLSDDFIFGMDSSSVIALEQSGVKYYDFYRKERDLFDILSENGINMIRVRVWNDPYDSEGHGYGGGNNDVAKAVEIGKRVTKYGMKLHVDFHYSDFWADPAKQKAPKAWANYTLDQKKEAVYAFTLDAMTQLKNAEVDVGMVQLGNETNNAKMCGVSDWTSMTALMAEGSKAVRATYPNALIAVHFTNPEKNGRLAGYAANLASAGLDYDVFGSSYYPYWHGSLENLSSVLGNVAKTYGKKVMVMETSYANTLNDTDFHGNTIASKGSGYPYDTYEISQQGQANYLHDLTETLANTQGCIGMSYWEGTWISVNQKTWAENSALWEEYGSGWASSYCAEYDPDDGGKWYGGSAVDNQCFFDRNGRAMDSLRTFTQVRVGSGESSETSGELSTEQSEEPSLELLPNGGFEDAKDTSWKISDRGGADYLAIVPYDYALEGKNALNFYDEAANSIDFTIEQTLEGLEAGSYEFSIHVMGGDAGDHSVTSFVQIGEGMPLTDNGVITVWQSWDEMKVSFDYDGTSSLRLGVTVVAASAGAWGYLDKGTLTKVA